MTTDQQIKYLDDNNLCFACLAENSVTLVSSTGSLWFIPDTSAELFKFAYNVVITNTISVLENQEKLSYGGDSYWYQIFKKIGNNSFRNLYVSPYVWDVILEEEEYLRN